MTLVNCKVGFRGIIKDILNVENNLHLLENGFTPDTEVEIISKSTLGSPIGIQLRGTIIALRKEEAECILV
ncbi:ferrous iron transport protein A [bacterium]|nr:ferrous iron transport protein A [bacterium]